MELLILLLERQGELVSREEIAERLWGKDVFVDVEHGINTAVRKIRLVLHDDPEKPRFVETVVGKGYRFAAAVSCDGNGSKLAARRAPEWIDPEAEQPGAENVAVPLAPSTIRNRRRVMLVMAAALVILIASAVWLLRRPKNASPNNPPAIKSLAVLPLKNLSGDPSQEYLADGMTEALIGRLSAIHDLRVISRTSVMRLKNSQLSAPETAKTLQVDALVEGSVIRQGNEIRVTAQLIRGATDEHLWSETYDRNVPDVLALQSDVAQAIARRVEITQTGPERQRLSAARRVVPEAYEAYLRGRFILQNANSKADVEKSIEHFEDAIRKDPNFALPYVGLGDAHDDLGTVVLGGAPRHERDQVISAARRALELDPELSDAHVLLADMAQKEWRWAEAEAEYRRALELSPNDVSALQGISSWFLCHGQMEEALASAEREHELDRSGNSTHSIAWAFFNARRYDDEIRELNSGLVLHPRDRQLLWDLGFVLTVKGEPNRAIAPLERAVSVSGRSSGTLDLLAAAYARAGRRDDALRLLAELKARRKTEYVPPAAFLITYIGLGDNEQAFAWLEEAYKEKFNILQFIKVHPFLDPLRGDPRFADLVKRVGL